MRLALKSTIRYRPSASTIAAVVCLSLIACRIARGSAFPTPVSRAGNYVVERVADDGTLILTTGQPVRLLGVEFPERTDAGAHHAQIQRDAASLLSRLTAGRRVTLELDRVRIDRRYNTLAYVHVGELLLNAKLIREGYATVDQRIPMQSARVDQLEEAEELARLAEAGLWAAP